MNDEIRNTNKITLEKLGIFLFVVVFFSVLFAIMLPLVSYSGTQKYNEIIGGLANFSVNKSAEILLFKIILIFVLCIVTILWVKYGNRESEDESTIPLGLYMIVITNTIYLFLYNDINIKLVSFSLIYLCCLVFEKKVERAKESLELFVYSYYMVFAYISVHIVWSQRSNREYLSNLTESGIIMLSLVVFVAVMLLTKTCGKNYDFFCKSGMQALIPLGLLIYEKNLYRVGEITQKIPYPKLYKWIVISIVLMGSLDTLLRMLWRLRNNIENSIYPATVATIFVINSYIEPYQIIPRDSWHHGEQISSWSQIIELGQKIYEDFCPSSGGFSIFLGAIYNMLGGKPTIYSAAYALFSLLITALLAYLLYININHDIALVLALLTGNFIYNRGLLVVPSFLILLLPRLMNNKSAWIRSWIILVMINGFYYPSIGVAFFAGTLPYAIVQFVMFIQTEWMEKKRHAIFWLSNAFVCTGVVASIPMFARMLKYILLLAGQTIEAEGLPLVQYSSSPEYFMAILPDGIRQVLYLAVRALLVAVPFVLPAVISAYLMLVHKKRFVVSSLGFVMSSMAIFSWVYYSYSLIRADKDMLVSRTGVALYIVGIVSVVAINRDEEFLVREAKKILIAFWSAVVAVLFVICGIASFPQVEDGVPVGSLQYDQERLISIKNVSEEFSTVAETDIERLGAGFISISQLGHWRAFDSFITQNKLQNEYFLGFPRFEYSMLNVKALYVDSSTILRSKKAQSALIQKLNEKRPFITGVYPHLNNMIIQWMRKEKYVVLANGLCVAPEKVEAYHLEQYVIRDEVASLCQELSMAPNVFGRSYSSIMRNADDKVIMTNRFELSNMSGCSINTDGDIFVDSCEDDRIVCLTLDDEIDGKYGYVFLDIEIGEKKKKSYEGSIDQRIQTYYARPDFQTMKLYWDENGELNKENMCGFEYRDGALLVPVGYNSSWVFNKHKMLCLQFDNQIPQGTKIRINKLEFVEL